jgi:hypothetical protein
MKKQYNLQILESRQLLAVGTENYNESDNLTTVPQINQMFEAAFKKTVMEDQTILSLKGRVDELCADGFQEDCKKGLYPRLQVVIDTLKGNALQNIHNNFLLGKDLLMDKNIDHAKIGIFKQYTKIAEQGIANMEKAINERTIFYGLGSKLTGWIPSFSLFGEEVLEIDNRKTPNLTVLQTTTDFFGITQHAVEQAAAEQAAAEQAAAEQAAAEEAKLAEALEAKKSVAVNRLDTLVDTHLKFDKSFTELIEKTAAVCDSHAKYKCDDNLKPVVKGIGADINQKYWDQINQWFSQNDSIEDATLDQFAKNFASEFLAAIQPAFDKFVQDSKDAYFKERVDAIIF